MFPVLGKKEKEKNFGKKKVAIYLYKSISSTIIIIFLCSQMELTGELYKIFCKRRDNLKDRVLYAMVENFKLGYYSKPPAVFDSAQHVRICAEWVLLCFYWFMCEKGKEGRKRKKEKLWEWGIELCLYRNAFINCILQLHRIYSILSAMSMLMLQFNTCKIFVWNKCFSSNPVLDRPE